MTEASVSVARADESRWRDVRAIRLEALADTPDAYGSTLADAEARPEQYWRAMAARANTFLADDGGRVVGMASGGTNDHESGTGWLYAMYVTPTHRGTAAAPRLVDAVCDWARANGYDRLFLNVAATVGRAQAFYGRVGFVATGATSAMDRDPASTLFTMVRGLD